MTRPLSEPSLERESSSHGYRLSRLERRPSPASTDDIPWARISRGFDAANQTIGSGSFVNLRANHTYNMGAGESGEGYFEVFNSSGNDIGIHVLQDGFYLITVELFWFSSVSTTWQLGFSIEGNDWNHYASFGGQTSTDMIGAVSLPHRISADTVVIGVVWQTGASRDVDAYYLEVARIGSWTGTTWESSLPAE